VTYQETIEYLFEQLPMYQRIGAAAYKKDLTNTLALCAFLGHPEKQLKCIHVAGTNGKGSVSHMLAAALQAAGYKVGLYVSPHYKDFRERIKINGAYISEPYVVDFVERMMPVIASIAPSFFEITVAMAFDYFKQEAVDYAIIETGLGGRLDSTNVITPLLSVITNISFDHMNMLGNTLEAIANEKAGIIKQNIAVLIGEHSDESDSVFSEKSSAMRSPIYFAEDMLQCDEFSTMDGAIQASFHSKENPELSFKIVSDFGGDYQKKNLRTAIAALILLRSQIPNLKEGNIAQGLSNLTSLTKFMGRWMTIKQAPRVIFDSAHNEAGLKEVIQQLQQLSFNKLHWVYGTVKDKDVNTNLSMLPKEATYYFASPQIPRGLEAANLKEQAALHGLFGEAYSSVQEAYENANLQAHANDLILVCGSIFVVAELI